jgi:N-acetylmuramoyl-L-alanine amidase
MVSYLMDPTEENRARAKVQWDLQGEISEQSRYRVTINPLDYPFTVRFTDSAQTIRYGPGKGYFAIFQPAGVEAEVIGAAGGWYRLKLSHSHFAWADSTLIERLPSGIRPPKSYVTSLRTYSWPNFVTVEIPLSGKHAYRVIEDDRRTLRLQLFGVTSNTDWIRYDFNDTLVDLATWSQPENDLYELRLELNQDIWGFDTYYIGNTFNLVLNRPPSENRDKLKGKTIVVDPGHSTDPGAIGPTGYREADANLGIAMVLGRMLESKGARVVMTRTDGSDTPLYDRPAVAKIHNADLFISIHNNALPDGVNPFTNNGVSTYYYHPHSIDLARDIQREMVKATGLPDHGLYHGNLAVNRPTQYPAVLVECAFMIIPEQEAALKTYRFRKTVAEAILKGVERFLKEYNHGK